MSGLYEKALSLLQKEHDVVAAGGGIVFDEDSGISKDDQKEILQEIEKSVTQNKLSIGPKAFLIQAQKKGILMPLLVNLLGVFLLLAGGGVLYYFFQRGETTLKGEVTAVASAEGRLIQELKREAEAKLLEKNREITDIQGRLTEIDKERQDLAANLDAKVQAREQELRQGMEAALAEEREKLRRQGVSEDDISRRLVALEAQKTGEFQRELSSFKKQAEEEKARAEDNLKALEKEYQASLAKAGEERQQVLEESRQREAELEKQLAAKTEALEAESQQARQELNRFAEQREKEQLASGQLIGFYTRLKGDLQASKPDQALTTLEGIRQYLNDPAIAALPTMQQRREVEFFVLDSLSSLVKSEQKKSEVDTSSLIAAANLVTDLRRRIQEGDDLLARGEAAEAEKKYGEALALIPEVNKTHRYLLGRQESGTGAAEAARRAELRSALTGAQTAFDAKDYAGAAEGYVRALAYLPEDPAVVELLAANLRQAGYELAADRQKRQDSAAAAAPLAEAERLYTQGRYREAIAAYTGVVDKFPASTQVRSALQGIGRAVDSLGKQLETGAGDAQGLRQQLIERTAEVETLKAALTKQGQSLEERAARLEKDLQDKVALAESLQAEKQMLSQEIASLTKEIEALKKSTGEAAAAAAAAAPQLDEAMKARLARLETIEGNYSRIMDSYKEYAAKEDGLISGKGEAGLMEAKLHLNAFLASTEETFPGLWNRIKRYDGAFEKAGRTSALEDVNDVLYELTLRDKPQERQQYLDAELARRKGDPLMAGLLKDLKKLQGAAAGGLKDVNNILGEAALRKKQEARELYLETEMVKNRSNPELFQFLGKLLDLVRPLQPAPPTTR